MDPDTRLVRDRLEVVAVVQAHIALTLALEVEEAELLVLDLLHEAFLAAKRVEVG